MNRATVRANARLQPFGVISERYGLTRFQLDVLVREGDLPVVVIPHIRKRLLDIHDVERAVASWKRGVA